MPERLRPHPTDIITGPESLPRNISYEHLVEKVGGKAAGLLWIQKHIPDIPMPRMIVVPPGIGDDEMIEVAKKQGLRFPWIIRASTPVDNLPGHEGEFSTRIVKYDIDQNLTDIDIVRRSHAYYDENKYPFKEATVIIAEYSESDLIGTLVAHPHREGFFMANVSNKRNEYNQDHAFYFAQNGQAYRSDNISLSGHKRAIPVGIDEQVATISQMYERIMQIPEFNTGMTYQLEFGPESAMLYQIRDFLPKQQAGFILNKYLGDDERDIDRQPIVLGITPKEGIIARVYRHEDSWHSKTKLEDGIIHSGYFPTITERPDDFTNDLPVAVMIEVRKANKIQFQRDVNLFTYSTGALAHDDIRAMRTTPLSIMNHSSYSWSDLEKDDYISLKSGNTVRIISDGVHVQIEKLSE